MGKGREEERKGKINLSRYLRIWEFLNRKMTFTTVISDIKYPNQISFEIRFWLAIHTPSSNPEFTEKCYNNSRCGWRPPLPFQPDANLYRDALHRGIRLTSCDTFSLTLAVIVMADLTHPGDEVSIYSGTLVLFNLSRAHTHAHRHSRSHLHA